MKYPKERKEAILKKMLPPHHQSNAGLDKEEGICEATHTWRLAARAEGRLLPAGDSTPSDWKAADKFAAVVETAALSEAELSVYCRQRGLYPEQIKAWRLACEQANDWDRSQTQCLKGARKVDEQRIRELECDLRIKEKALAETAAPAWTSV